MDYLTEERLKKAGFVQTTVAECLGLTPEEEAKVEKKVKKFLKKQKKKVKK